MALVVPKARSDLWVLKVLRDPLDRKAPKATKAIVALPVNQVLAVQPDSLVNKARKASREIKEIQASLANQVKLEEPAIVVFLVYPDPVASQVSLVQQVNAVLKVYQASLVNKDRKVSPVELVSLVLLELAVSPELLASKAKRVIKVTAENEVPLVLLDRKDSLDRKVIVAPAVLKAFRVCLVNVVNKASKVIADLSAFPVHKDAQASRVSKVSKVMSVPLVPLDLRVLKVNQACAAFRDCLGLAVSLVNQAARANQDNVAKRVISDLKASQVFQAKRDAPGLQAHKVYQDHEVLRAQLVCKVRRVSQAEMDWMVNRVLLGNLVLEAQQVSQVHREPVVRKAFQVLQELKAQRAKAVLLDVAVTQVYPVNKAPLVPWVHQVLRDWLADQALQVRAACPVSLDKRVKLVFRAHLVLMADRSLAPLDSLVQQVDREPAVLKDPLVKPASLGAQDPSARKVSAVHEAQQDSKVNQEPLDRRDRKSVV